MIRKLYIFCAVSFFVVSFSIFKTPQAQAQACTSPATATGVTVEFPGCTGTSCDLTQASCKWNTQADAASYNVTITQVESGTIVKNNESETAATTKITFPITQGKTYKCSVVAVSSCGGLSAAATDQLLCQADAIITPVETVPPTATPIPPTPTIAKPGGIVQTIALISGVAIAIIGGLLLLIL